MATGVQELRREASKVGCGVCGSPVGQLCVTRGGAYAALPHSERVRAARQLTKTQKKRAKPVPSALQPEMFDPAAGVDPLMIPADVVGGKSGLDSTYAPPPALSE